MLIYLLIFVMAVHHF